MSRVVLAFDEGPGVGLGHRKRCEALLLALRGVGVDAVLADASQTPPADVLVVDSYVHRADDQRFDASRRVGIDDLDRPLAVDVLVDPNPGRTATDVAARVLAGVRYALVDPTLVERRAPPPSSTGAKPVVLVTMGGADTDGHAARVASAVAAGADVRVVRGPWGAPLHTPPEVTVIDAPPVLADHLVAADIVVTAAGLTMLEAMVLGKPTIAVVVAPNQRRAASAAAHAGAALVVDTVSAADAVRRLVNDAATREELAASAANYVDGRGAARVAREVAALA